MKLQCPRCNDILTQGTYADEQSMLCPALHGVMIQQKHLNKMIQRLLPDLESVVDIDSTIAKIPDKSPIAHCPSCKGATEYYGYMEADIAMIDFCSQCGWMWIDSDELQPIAKMHAKFQKVKVRIDRQEIPRNTDIVTARMVSEIAANAILAGFVFG